MSGPDDWTWAKYDHCPACGEKDAPFGVYGMQVDTRTKPMIQMVYICCLKCGLVFQAARLSDESMAEFYALEYRDLTSHGAEHGLRPADIVMEKDRAHRVMSYAMDVPGLADLMDLPGTQFLDVGCGSGELLQHICELYPSSDVEGIEPNKDTHDVCVEKGFSIARSLSFVPDHSYHVVSAVHVLEHVTEPYEFLVQIRSKLASKGYLIVDLPHLQGSLRRVLGLPHVSAWMPETLQSVAERAGFQVVRMWITMHQDMRLLPSDITLIARVKPDTIVDEAPEGQGGNHGS
jgi:ubiquinone/menaquinone biosynthesis C-methylase UbiE